MSAICRGALRPADHLESHRQGGGRLVATDCPALTRNTVLATAPTQTDEESTNNCVRQRRVFVLRPRPRPPPPPARGALEGKGPQRRPRKRLDRRLEEVAKAVGGGYCRLQMPWKPAFGVRGTVAGRRLGALEGRGGGSSPSANASLPPAPRIQWLCPPEYRHHCHPPPPVGKLHITCFRDKPSMRWIWPPDPQSRWLRGPLLMP